MELSERELLIVRLRFVEEQTQSQIGEVLGVSQMQVSRLLGSILPAVAGVDGTRRGRRQDRP